MVDESRIEELIARRQQVGLSDDEADELGRLFAEREGKTYSNARSGQAPPPAQEAAPAEDAGQPEDGAGPGKSTT